MRFALICISSFLLLCALPACGDDGGGDSGGTDPEPTLCDTYCGLADANCTDDNASIIENCNGVDDDCDGAVDEGFETAGDDCDGPDADADALAESDVFDAVFDESDDDAAPLRFNAIDALDDGTGDDDEWGGA